jgi:hypothetical protein
MMQRIHRYKADYGMSNYYKFYDKKYGSKVDKKKFNKIVTEFNKGLVDLILNSNISYKMPYLNLILEIRKDKRKPRIENGTLVNPVPVDWKRTKALWERDKEAKEKKLLVRYNNSHSSGYVFRLFLKKFNSTIKNKGVLKIKTNRKFQRQLSKRIKNLDEPFDAYLYYK